MVITGNGMREGVAVETVVGRGMPAVSASVGGGGAVEASVVDVEGPWIEGKIEGFTALRSDAGREIGVGDRGAMVGESTDSSVLMRLRCWINGKGRPF